MDGRAKAFGGLKSEIGISALTHSFFSMRLVNNVGQLEREGPCRMKENSKTAKTSGLELNRTYQDWLI